MSLGRTCSCKNLLVKVGNREVKFRDVSPALSYLPSIVRNEEDAIYGITSEVKLSQLPILLPSPVVQRDRRT
jgi:hypothetical protein